MPPATMRSTRGMSAQDSAVYFHARRRQTSPPWELEAVPLVLPAALADGPAVPAYVNHDRWVIDCPFCNSAELADPDDPRFLCSVCYNAGAGQRWLPVFWPADRPEIEAALDARADPRTRNWNPGESVIDLLAQTLEREA